MTKKIRGYFRTSDELQIGYYVTIKAADNIPDSLPELPELPEWHDTTSENDQPTKDTKDLATCNKPKNQKPYSNAPYKDCMQIHGRKSYSE